MGVNAWGQAKHGYWGKQSCSVISRCATNGGTTICPWNIALKRVRVLCIICRLQCTVHILRVRFLGLGARRGWYISSETEYTFETNSEQVPRGKKKKKKKKNLWVIPPVKKKKKKKKK